MIKWTWKTTPLNVDRKTVRVVCVRTEGAQVDGEWTDIVSQDTIIVPKARARNAIEKLAMADQIWAKWLLVKDRNEKIAEFIDDLDEAGAANLEGRE